MIVLMSTQAMVPRLGYLPCVAEQIKHFFQVNCVRGFDAVPSAHVSSVGSLSFPDGGLEHHALPCRPQHLLPPGDDTPWFDYEGQALQWCVQHGNSIMARFGCCSQHRIS